MENRLQPRASNTRRSPEVLGLPSSDRVDRILSLVDLVREQRRGEEGEPVGVAPGVIFYSVPSINGLRDDLGVIVDPLPHAEEARPSIVQIQNVEDRRGHVGEGAVVNRQSDLTAGHRCCWHGSDVRAQQSGTWQEAAEGEAHVVGDHHADQERPQMRPDGQPTESNEMGYR